MATPFKCGFRISNPDRLIDRSEIQDEISSILDRAKNYKVKHRKSIKALFNSPDTAIYKLRQRESKVQEFIVFDAKENSNVFAFITFVNDELQKSTEISFPKNIDQALTYLIQYCDDSVDKENYTLLMELAKGKNLTSCLVIDPDNFLETLELLGEILKASQRDTHQADESWGISYGCQTNITLDLDGVVFTITPFRNNQRSYRIHHLTMESFADSTDYLRAMDKSMDAISHLYDTLRFSKGSLHDTGEAYSRNIDRALKLIRMYYKSSFNGTSPIYHAFDERQTFLIHDGSSLIYISTLLNDEDFFPSCKSIDVFPLALTPEALSGLKQKSGLDTELEYLCSPMTPLKERRVDMRLDILQIKAMHALNTGLVNNKPYVLSFNPSGTTYTFGDTSMSNIISFKEKKKEPSYEVKNTITIVRNILEILDRTIELDTWHIANFFCPTLFCSWVVNYLVADDFKKNLNVYRKTLNDIIVRIENGEVKGFENFIEDINKGPLDFFQDPMLDEPSGSMVGFPVNSTLVTLTVRMSFCREEEELFITDATYSGLTMWQAAIQNVFEKHREEDSIPGFFQLSLLTKVNADEVDIHVTRPFHRQYLDGTLSGKQSFILEVGNHFLKFLFTCGENKTYSDFEIVECSTQLNEDARKRLLKMFPFGPDDIEIVDLIETFDDADKADLIDIFNNNRPFNGVRTFKIVEKQATSFYVDIEWQDDAICIKEIRGEDANMPDDVVSLLRSEYHKRPKGEDGKSIFPDTVQELLLNSFTVCNDDFFGEQYWTFYNGNVLYLNRIRAKHYGNYAQERMLKVDFIACDKLLTNLSTIVTAIEKTDNPLCNTAVDFIKDRIEANDRLTLSKMFYCIPDSYIRLGTAEDITQPKQPIPSSIFSFKFRGIEMFLEIEPDGASRVAIFDTYRYYTNDARLQQIFLEANENRSPSHIAAAYDIIERVSRSIKLVPYLKPKVLRILNNLHHDYHKEVRIGDRTRYAVVDGISGEHVYIDDSEGKFYFCETGELFEALDLSPTLTTYGFASFQDAILDWREKQGAVSATLLSEVQDYDREEISKRLNWHVPNSVVAHAKMFEAINDNRCEFEEILPVKYMTDNGVVLIILKNESVSALDGLVIDTVLEAICPNCETVEIETSTSSVAFAVNDSILSTYPLSGIKVIPMLYEPTTDELFDKIKNLQGKDPDRYSVIVNSVDGQEFTDIDHLSDKDISSVVLTDESAEDPSLDPICTYTYSQGEMVFKADGHEFFDPLDEE
ncbi:hypothetical protein WH47_09792 [Habropoda laboriosa]|uniref:Uncharacterized protein n=1 Tax=Habropoda laboriosa TaxID=597456 RepID=A0A0L7QIU3_9HYME|nr:hypothetical protein WH47_09792 [Habropoda laboriosa]